jgi:hypothetical protein
VRRLGWLEGEFAEKAERVGGYQRTYIAAAAWCTAELGRVKGL